MPAKSANRKKRPAIDENDEKKKNVTNKRLKTRRDNLDDYKIFDFDFDLKGNQEDNKGDDKDYKESNDDLFEEKRQERKESKKDYNVENERMKTSKSGGNFNKYIVDFTEKDTWDEGDKKKKEEEKPKVINLMKKKNKLTESPSKSIAMRLDKEDKWAEEFMSLWTKRHSEYVMAIYE